MASLTHQWLLCLFATEVVKILYHCCLPPPLQPPLSFFTFCFAAATTTINNLLFTPIERREARYPLSFRFMTSVMWVCMCSVSIYPAVRVPFDITTDWYFSKQVPIETLWTLLLISISHIFRLQDFSFFFVFSFLFCFVPVRMYQQTPEMQVLSTTRFSLWTIAVDTCICFLFFFSLLISGSTKALV